MAIVIIDGVPYTVPEVGQRNWGQSTTDLLIKLGESALKIKGGSIPLTSEADFGPTAGLKSVWFSSRSSNSADAGVVRLANLDAINWRDAANSTNLTLTVDGSDDLTFNGSKLITDGNISALAGDGLSESAGVLSVNVDDVGIEITTDILNLKDSGVVTSKIADANVTEAKIADDAVTAAKIAADVAGDGLAQDVVDGSLDVNVDDSSLEIATDVVQVKDAGITEAKLAADSVTTAKILDANVTTAKIADSNVTTDKILDANVTTDKLADSSVTTAKIADANVTTDKILDANVTTAKIADANVTSAKLASDAVTTVKITDSNVTGAKLEDNIELPGTEGFVPPKGTAAQRPVSPVIGETRYNTDTNALENYNGTAWQAVGSGSGSGGKNYILNPSAASDTSDVTNTATTGSWTIARTTTAAELPEETLGTAFKISGSSLTVGDTVEWAIEATGIDDADGGRFGRAKVSILDISGSINGEYSIQVYDVDNSVYVGDEETVTGTGTYYLDVPLIAAGNYEFHLKAQTASPSYIGLSSVTIEPVIQTTASLGGWKSYEEPNVTITGTNSWVTTNASITPYKDPVTKKWFARGNIRGTTSSSPGSTVTVAGMSFPAWNQAGTLSTNTTASPNECYAIASTSNFKIEQGTSRSAWWFSFDVELASKPTWADWDNTAPTISDVQYENAAITAINDSGSSIGANSPIPWDSATELAPGIDFDGTDTFTAKVKMKLSVGFIRLRTSGTTSIALNLTDTSGTILPGGEKVIATGSQDRHEGGGIFLLEAGQQFQFRPNIAITLSSVTDENKLYMSRIPDYSARKAGLPTSDAADETKQYLIPSYQTYTLSLSSDGPQNMTGDIVFIKIGNTVTFTSDGTVTHDSAHTPASSSAVPADFRPSSDIYNTYRYSETAGFTVIISSTGTVSIQYRNETTTVNQTSTSTAITGSYNVI